MLFLKKVFNVIISMQISKLATYQKIKSMLRPILISLGIYLFCVTAYSQDWVPVYEEPKHQLVFENDQVIILNVNLPPGYVSLYHKHQIDLLYVTIAGTKVWAEPLNGQKRMKQLGKVEIPQEAFLAVLQVGKNR